MLHESIEGAPARRMQGHREDDRRVVSRDPAELAEDLPIVLDVLDDVEGTDQVEGAIGEWQAGDLAPRSETAAGLQVGEGRSSDVDACVPEGGAADASPPVGCAGYAPVFANGDLGISSVDPTVSGGDQFDLATIGTTNARFVRIRDVQGAGAAPTAGFDLDAVAIVNGKVP